MPPAAGFALDELASSSSRRGDGTWPVTWLGSALGGAGGGEMGRSKAPLGLGNEWGDVPARFHPLFFCSSKADSYVLDNRILSSTDRSNARLSSRNLRVSCRMQRFVELSTTKEALGQGDERTSPRRMSI